ncbi:type II toxin-antitoxin system RelE/ParE family toxin [Duganella zoogloeoides]|uniref:Type II toxin-antitoxin system RelE/ParE family toxin n=1 Tax=Duganella zoogloeoides TaxID=75659 RepID=A0ABZ0XWD0_9BURK|nr:type II toxin-antitoxin system RelE/ParE family toxin [Duganella zoogloeoides]WQH04051.1 type II toxin-antitoxin system RelE/ParE family toxin [Duganella zoogloeoides]
MMQIIQSETFNKWAAGLRDPQARALVASRLLRLSQGMANDIAALGDSLFELRLHMGPGYRIYFIREGATVVVLLSGGTKGSQVRDILKAKHLAHQWRHHHD